MADGDNPAPFTRWQIAIQIVWMIMVAGLLIGGLRTCMFDDKSQGWLAEQTLVAEYRLLRMPRAASQFGFSQSHKVEQAYVGAYFHSALSWQQLRSFYDVELGRLGWKFYADRKQTTLYGDFGGRVATYCKGPYQANVEFSGPRENAGWEYALDVSWGLSGGSRDCPRAG